MGNQFEADIKCVPQMIKFIEDELQAMKIDKKKIALTLLSSEEILVAMIKQSNEDSEIIIKTNKFWDSVKLEFKSAGQPFDKEYLKDQFAMNEELSAEEQSVVMNLMGRLFSCDVKFKSNRGVNHCTIQVQSLTKKSILYNLTALILGLLVGEILLNLAPDTINNALISKLLTPINTMFMNAIKAMVGPLVFLSIASSIAGFDDIKSLGKIAAKVMTCYILTSIVAIMVGYFVYQLFPIGSPSLKDAIVAVDTSFYASNSVTNVDMVSTIVGIIPSDIVTPFLQSNMLQIMFCAVLAGIAASLCGSENIIVRFINDANEVVSKMTSIVVGFMPLAIFSNVVIIILTIDTENLIKVFAWIPVCYFGFAIMIAFYCLIVAIFGGLSPKAFLNAVSPAMSTAFYTNSSNVTVPTTLDVCKNRLKIPAKLYAFSIPLGATVNMDGTCIMLMITGMFMAKIYSISLSPSMLLAMAVLILTLSIGAPAIPGSGIICIASVISMIGVPTEVLGLIIGIYSIVGRAITTSNVTGDLAVTTIVGRKMKAVN